MLLNDVKDILKVGSRTDMIWLRKENLGTLRMFMVPDWRFEGLGHLWHLRSSWLMIMKLGWVVLVKIKDLFKQIKWEHNTWHFQKRLKQIWVQLSQLMKLLRNFLEHLFLNNLNLTQDPSQLKQIVAKLSWLMKQWRQNLTYSQRLFPSISSLSQPLFVTQPSRLVWVLCFYSISENDKIKLRSDI